MAAGPNLLTMDHDEDRKFFDDFEQKSFPWCCCLTVSGAIAAVFGICLVVTLVCVNSGGAGDDGAADSTGSENVNVMSLNVLGLGATTLPASKEPGKDQLVYWLRAQEEILDSTLSGEELFKNLPNNLLVKLLKDNEGKDNGVSFLALQEDLYVPRDGKKAPKLSYHATHRTYTRVGFLEPALNRLGYKLVAYSIHDGMPANNAKFDIKQASRDEFAKHKIGSSIEEILNPNEDAVERLGQDLGRPGKIEKGADFKLGNTLFMKSSSNATVLKNYQKTFTVWPAGVASDEEGLPANWCDHADQWCPGKAFVSGAVETMNQTRYNILARFNVVWKKLWDFPFPSRSAALVEIELNGEKITVGSWHAAGGKFDDTAMIAFGQYSIGRDMATFFGSGGSGRVSVLMGDTNMKQSFGKEPLDQFKAAISKTKGIKPPLDMYLGAGMGKLAQEVLAKFPVVIGDQSSKDYDSELVKQLHTIVRMYEAMEIPASKPGAKPAQSGKPATYVYPTPEEKTADRTLIENQLWSCWRYPNRFQDENWTFETIYRSRDLDSTVMGTVIDQISFDWEKLREKPMQKIIGGLSARDDLMVHLDKVGPDGKRYAIRATDHFPVYGRFSVSPSMAAAPEFFLQDVDSVITSPAIPVAVLGSPEKLADFIVEKIGTSGKSEEEFLFLSTAIGRDVVKNFVHLHHEQIQQTVKTKWTNAVDAWKNQPFVANPFPRPVVGLDRYGPEGFEVSVCKVRGINFGKLEKSMKAEETTEIMVQEAYEIEKRAKGFPAVFQNKRFYRPSVAVTAETLGKDGGYDMWYVPTWGRQWATPGHLEEVLVGKGVGKPLMLVEFRTNKVELGEGVAAYKAFLQQKDGRRWRTELPAAFSGAGGAKLSPLEKSNSHAAFEWVVDKIESRVALEGFTVAPAADRSFKRTELDTNFGSDFAGPNFQSGFVYHYEATGAWVIDYDAHSANRPAHSFSHHREEGTAEPFYLADKVDPHTGIGKPTTLMQWHGTSLEVASRIINGEPKATGGAISGWNKEGEFVPDANLRNDKNGLLGFGHVNKFGVAFTTSPPSSTSVSVSEEEELYTTSFPDADAQFETLGKQGSFVTSDVSKAAQYATPFVLDSNSEPGKPKNLWMGKVAKAYESAKKSSGFVNFSEFSKLTPKLGQVHYTEENAPKQYLLLTEVEVQKFITLFADMPELQGPRVPIDMWGAALAKPTSEGAQFLAGV